MHLQFQVGKGPDDLDVSRRVVISNLDASFRIYNIYIFMQWCDRKYISPLVIIYDRYLNVKS